MGRSHTKQDHEEIRARLRAAASEHGRWLTIAEWEAQGRQPSWRSVVAVFGTWTGAWEAAGFPVERRWCGPCRGRKGWTREEAIAALKDVHRDTPVLTRAEWRRRGLRPSDRTLIRLFGSFHAALAAAGLPAHRTGAPSDEEILAGLMRLRSLIGTIPCRGRWDAWPGRPCGSGTVVRRFGSWTEALKIAFGPEVDPADLEPRRLLPVRWLRDPAHSDLLASLPLTARDRQVLTRVQEGANYRTIAEELHLSTVRVGQIVSSLWQWAMASTKRHRPSPAPNMTRDEALQRLRSVLQAEGRIPGRRTWVGEPDLATIHALFRSWADAWAEALLSIEDPDGRLTRLRSALALLESLLRDPAASRPRRSDWQLAPQAFSADEISHLFGGWVSAWQIAAATAARQVHPKAQVQG